MRITKIVLENYRAFYGKNEFDLTKSSKNLMVYGENGSGKSSIFHALKTFFKASIEDVELEENIFIPDDLKGKVKIEIDFKENADSASTWKVELNSRIKRITGIQQAVVASAFKLKSFYDYRELLKTHMNHTEKVNIFHLLVKDIIPYAVNQFSTNEIYEEWKEIEELLTKRKRVHIVANLKDKTDVFAKGLGDIINRIKGETNVFLDFFEKGMKIDLEYTPSYYDETEQVIKRQEVNLKITLFNKPIAKHQFFLNEARLSALAICLYLACIRMNPLPELRVMVLDDLLIGLDMGNRLPLLKILDQYFINPGNPVEEFQVVMTTYDKVWFELVKNYFGNTKWKYYEIYSKGSEEGKFEIPLIKSDSGYLEKAKFYLNEKDYKASAVYIRTEFEKVIKTICHKHSMPVKYKVNAKELDTNDFWDAISNHTNLDENIKREMETYRGVVMNPFSHYDLEKPEFKKELENTIDVIEKLNQVVESLQKLDHTKVFKEKNEKLESKNKLQEKAFKNLKEAYKKLKNAATKA